MDHVRSCLLDSRITWRPSRSAGFVDHSDAISNRREPQRASEGPDADTGRTQHIQEAREHREERSRTIA